MAKISEYQKLKDENRKLLLDIRILTTSGLSVEKLMLLNKYRENLKEGSAENDLVQFINFSQN